MLTTGKAFDILSKRPFLGANRIRSKNQAKPTQNKRKNTAKIQQNPSINREIAGTTW